jgi:Transposase DDE domain group 1
VNCDVQNGDQRLGPAARLPVSWAGLPQGDARNGGETICFAPKPVRTSATSASGAPSATRPTSSLNGRRQRTARSRGKHDDAGKSRPPRPECERCDSVLAHAISRAPRRHAVGFPRRCYGRLSAGRRSRASSARIKEGKGAIKWTRLSCRTFAANAVRLQLHALAYNLANFMRTLGCRRRRSRGR